MPQAGLPTGLWLRKTERMTSPFDNPLRFIEELTKTATSLSTERNLKRLLSLMLTSVRTLTHAEEGKVYLLDRTKRYLYVEVCQNTIVDAHVREGSTIELYRDGKRNVSHICAYCTFVNKLLNVSDIYDYTGFDFHDVYTLDALTGYRTASVIVVPLRSYQGLTHGVLQLVNSSPFPAQIESIVVAFASQAAVAIENVQLMNENRHLAELLERTKRALEQENSALRKHLDAQYGFARIIGTSARMQQVFSLMEKVVDSDVAVLLMGETGTGKELVASTIHHNSQRRNREFVAQNCAAMPEHLLESEFFGYRRGAFTGAETDKKGLLEIADRGTLFLDEIGDMPLGMQAKLLRVLQEGEIRPLGSVKTTKVNVRVIAATHRDLQHMVETGQFREDLYYRLCVFPIDIPPLRERQEDVLALLNHWLAIAAEQYQKAVPGFTPQALDCLVSYAYPGNIRELRNVVERAVLLVEDKSRINCEHLPGHIVGKSKSEETVPVVTQTQGSLPEIVRHFEASIILQKLREHNWNQTKTAQELKVARRTLIEKMHRLDIRP